MKTTVELDDELAAEVEKTVRLVKEQEAIVLRMAIRAGLPLIADRFQIQRPPGYFSDDYPLPEDRLELENAMAQVQQVPDR